MVTLERSEESQCPARKRCFASLDHDILCRAMHFERALGHPGATAGLKRPFETKEYEWGITEDRASALAG